VSETLAKQAIARPKRNCQAIKKALSQLPVGNKEGWSLDEKQTVGGADAATEPTWMFLRRVCVRPDS